MTTFELAGQLARRLKKASLPALSVPAAMDIVEAINTGLQECYELLPSWQRKTVVSLELAAPATVNLTLTNGSVTLAGGTFTEAQIGRSVVVAGDPSWNEVQSATELLDAYQGATGAHAATVYGDSAYNELTNFDGFASPPRLADTREVLKLFDARRAGLAGEVGRPRYYWTEPAAASLGTTPPVYLRVYPAPDRAYMLRIDTEFRPSILTYTNVHRASTIPLADQLIHRGLIPLCEVRLLRSPEWADPSKQNLVLEDARAARGFLANQRQTVHVPENRVFTPVGY
jgi:hypothetical protein